MIRILQANLHRCRLADDLLAQLRLEMGVNLLMLSEQFDDKRGPGWYADILGTAALWVPSVGRFPIEANGAGRGFVWATVCGVTYVSCYFSPNDPIAEFQGKLDGLEDTIREMEGPFVVAGDFNARALEWGMETTNTRGRRTLEMADRLGLSVANIGNVTTYRRPGFGESIPDITMVSEAISPRISGWRVIEDFTGSDHQYITFSVERHRHVNTRDKVRRVGWNVAKLHEEVLTTVITRGAADVLETVGPSCTVVEATMGLIRRGCNASMPKRKNLRGNRKAVYWWTDEIAALRRRCIQCRRRITRTRRRNPEAAELGSAELREAKRELKRAIVRSKKLKWEELRQDVNRDPWGLGYRVVMRKLGARSPGPSLEADQMERIVDALFPTHRARDQERPLNTTDEVPLFTVEELRSAAGSLQSKKAPGPDGIPPEVMKAVARSCPQLLLNMYNCCLKEGKFHKSWKSARLVLISKGKGDPTAPSAYRPLCMLDVAGKLYERLLKSRLLEAIQQAGDLSERQHGFRRGHSTVGAVEQEIGRAHV